MTPTSRAVRFALLTAALAAGGVLTSGCSTVGAHQAFTYKNAPGASTYSYDRALDTPAQPFFKTAYNTASSPRTVRNRIMYELMGMVDDYYYRYTVVLRQDFVGKGILSDAIGVSTSLAATAAGGEELKTLLSAISTAAQGINKAIDANVLLGNTIQAIRLQMDAARADIATEIIVKLREQNVTEYPIEAGLRDIIRYYDAGTVTSGVATLSKTSGREKADAEAEQTAKALNLPAAR